MLCLEVTLNGEPCCVAARHDGLVGAGVSRHVDVRGRRSLELSVFSIGPTGFEQWDAKDPVLKLGDVVTVRVVERETGDGPSWPSLRAPARIMRPPLFQHVSGGVEVEVFLWVWLVVGAALILAFG